MAQTSTSGIADAVRAEMARKRISVQGMAADIRMPRRTLHRRLAGGVPFRTDELSAIATRLDVPLSALLPESEPAA